MTEKEMIEQKKHDVNSITFLPSWDAISSDRANFLEAEITVDKKARSFSDKLLCQKQQSLWVVQYPPSSPLDTMELDRLYSLPFTRKEHPLHENVPAYRMIRHSITIVRGCSGNCSFCAITRHQGPVITSRSKESILEEVEFVCSLKGFKGTITDLGGPTANLYGTECRKNECKRHDCLAKRVCPHLKINEDAFLALLEKITQMPRVKHAYISSGLRMELLLKTPKLVEKILLHHTPGAMKIAPEHTEENVLRLMHKQPNLVPDFLEMCKEISKKVGKRFFFSPYFMSAHPGCTVKDMEALTSKIKNLGLHVKAFQDFTPTPGTLSTAMYVSGLDRDTRKPIFIPKQGKERRCQRMVLEKVRKKRSRTKR
jgi:uncharacterized radical SAM protein YgiQ